jgi:hypothetical protein
LDFDSNVYKQDLPGNFQTVSDLFLDFHWPKCSFPQTWVIGGQEPISVLFLFYSLPLEYQNQ